MLSDWWLLQIGEEERDYREAQITFGTGRNVHYLDYGGCFVVLWVYTDVKTNQVARFKCM